MSAARPVVASAPRWLLLGALAGVAIAAATLVRGGSRNGAGAVAVPAEAVAVVNGQPITRDALARFTGALARERAHRPRSRRAAPGSSIA